MKSNVKTKHKEIKMVDLENTQPLAKIESWDDIRQEIDIGDKSRIKVGEMLIRMKLKLPHGEFEAACAREIPNKSQMTLRRWMDLARGPLLNNKENERNETFLSFSNLELEVAEKKLEEIKAAAPGTITNPTQTVKRLEAKIEKLQAKTQPKVEQPKPAVAPPAAPKQELPKETVEEFQTRMTRLRVEAEVEAKARLQKQLDEAAQFRLEAERAQAAKAEISGKFDLATARKIFGLEQPTPEFLAWMLKFYNRNHHPDRPSGDATQMTRINQAYQVLINFYK